jgi:hypothetical protein
MALHVMIDLETLSVRPDAVILTLGAVKFDPFEDTLGEELALKFDIDGQTAMGRHIDEDTLRWWGEQTPEAQEEAFSTEGRLTVDAAMDQFHKFVWQSGPVWSHGSVFDIIILENLYTQLGRAKAWEFWSVRDTRTMFDLGVDPEMPKVTAHRALDDAKAQAIAVQNVYRKLGIKRANR